MKRHCCLTPDNFIGSSAPSSFPVTLRMNSEGQAHALTSIRVCEVTCLWSCKCHILAFEVWEIVPFKMVLSPVFTRLLKGLTWELFLGTGCTFAPLHSRFPLYPNCAEWRDPRITSVDKVMTAELISWGVVTQLTVNWLLGGFWSNVECF